MTTIDPELAPRVRVARVAQIWRRSRWAVFLYLLLFIPLGIGTPLASDHPLVFLATLGAFASTGLMRWRTGLARPAPTDPAEADRWIQRYGLYTAAAGLIWGFFACYMQIVYRGMFLQFVILLIAAGIACLALAAFAGERRLTLTYLACAMLPTLAGAAYRGGPESALIVTSMVIFLGALINQIVELNDWFVRSTVEGLLMEKSRREAEAGARVKSEFLANMSHELRTPMNGVMGTIELLMQTGLDVEQTTLARTSHRSAEALLDILNDILDFSKMSAGKLDFVRQDFLLRNAIEDVFDLLGPRAVDKGIDLGYSIDSDVPDWVCGDEGRLRQVLINLVGNAIKFSYSGQWPNGGSVFVEARLLKDAEDGVHVQFTVNDQGQGMTQHALSKLFEPFMQADTSTSRRFGGTGLGLAISRQLIGAMGGAITAESAEQAGSKFTFDLRLGAADHNHAEAPAATGCRVLVIEPAPLSRRTIGQLIARHDADVQLAATLEEAATYVAEGPFQCVLAGMYPNFPPSELRAEVEELFSGAVPPIFLMHHRGEAVDSASVQAFPLVRPIRASQVAELLVAASCLPRRTVPVPQSTPARLAGHVLVAEDNQVNQMLAKRLLEALGLTAEVVPNGVDALNALAVRPFQLVLMDCQMPGMDGYEATRRLRRMPGLANIPVVAMTANAMKGDRELCLAAGMSDYVSKPIRLERLREILSRYLPAAAPVSNSGRTK